MVLKETWELVKSIPKIIEVLKYIVIVFVVMVMFQFVIIMFSER